MDGNLSGHGSEYITLNSEDVSYIGLLEIRINLFSESILRSVSKWERMEDLRQRNIYQNRLCLYGALSTNLLE